jgi:hypothetical protein
MNLIENYKMKESGRIINFAKTIYDVEKESPYYKK